MSDYVVSARKYRPDSFESLIGQDNIARTLKNSILRGQLAHAYLFCGPRGVGKTSAARIFAKTINCSNPGPDMEPCGECESCRSFKEGRSYCIHELDAASNNGVEDIKALMEQVQIPPQVGRYSVFIIDEVHMLSTQAFNAFLKTLEEPPAHAIFILATTEKHKIIPTILSRCQTYDFNRISVPDIVRNLKEIASKENIKADDKSLHVIAHKADGAMRDALTIFDQTVAFCGADIRYEDVIRNLNVLDYEYSFKLVDAFLSADYATSLLVFDEILRKGFNAIHFVSALSSHLRDLIVSKTGGLESLIDLPDSLKENYKNQSARCSLKFLYDALGITTQCEAGYRTAVNQRLHIEFALMKLAFLSGVPDSMVQVPARKESPAAVKPEPAAEKPEPVIAKPEPAAPEAQPAKPVEPEEKKTVKKAAKLSLSSLLDDEEEMVIELSDEKETVKDSQLPSDEEIIGRWQDLAQLQQAQPRLANALSHSKLEIKAEDDSKTVEFAVVNEAQKKWIEDRILRNLESQFCKLLNCGKIKLVPTVIPEEEHEDKKYMPSEKAEDLMNKNAEVRNLVSDLGLDIR
ncbi:MAG: DNA polymerase III subunit gamma/tau [Bacteroidales bacterium]|nr:DNA polymerase III subunit gamma/tau [Bacteroidales bacterium]